MNELRHVAEGVRTVEAGNPFPYFVPPFPGRFPYAQRSVMIRLADGSLWVHSLRREIVELPDAIQVAAQSSSGSFRRRSTRCSAAEGIGSP